MFTALDGISSNNFQNALKSNFYNFNPNQVANLGYGLESEKDSQTKNQIDNYTEEEKTHVQNVLSGIHQRIEEKFRDYRRAFRHFDINFDGSLSFQEFIAGCEYSGINLSI